MIFNLFGGGRSNVSYKGSELASLIQGRVRELNTQPFDPQSVASAMQREHPHFLSGARTDVQAQAWEVLAKQVIRLITFSTTGATMYGDAIDELNGQNPAAALALATCLIQYADAADIPFEASDGGYRRYFSAYFVLRRSVAVFGMLEPWIKLLDLYTHIPEGERRAMRDLMGDPSMDQYERLVPVVERQTLKLVLQGVAASKAAIDLMATAMLPKALNAPQSMMAHRWPSPTAGPPGPDGGGTCTCCNGSGKSAGCGGCNGTGRLSRLGMGGTVEITTCAVCGGSGRARCDYAWELARRGHSDRYSRSHQRIASGARALQAARSDRRAATQKSRTAWRLSELLRLWAIRALGSASHRDLPMAGY